MQFITRFRNLKNVPMRCCLVALLGVVVAAPSAHADEVSYANSTNPLAFFPLQSQSQGSSVNGYTTTYMNGAADVSSNGGPEASAVSLNGVNNSTPEYVGTSLYGGIDGAGSISAWVNLAAGLTGGQVEYIAGESQNGNDFDFQFVNSSPGVESLCFYTDAGSDTCGTVDDSTLVNQWNMVTATYNSATGDQDVYLNGVLLAENSAGSGGMKVDQFTIGYSTTFGGRDLDGLVSDVGVWNYQLDGTQVTGLYDAASTTTPSATPEPSSLMLLGTSILGAAGAVRRRMRNIR